MRRWTHRSLARGARVMLAASLAACSGGSDAADSPPATSASAAAGVNRAEIGPQDPEARAWVEPGDGKVSLAANWFDSVTDAQQFIARLYAAGAERVVIAAESIREESDGFRSATAIRVQLPRDAARRAGVLAAIEAEARASGRTAAPDTGQQVQYMGWD